MFFPNYEHKNKICTYIFQEKKSIASGKKKSSLSIRKVIKTESKAKLNEPKEFNRVLFFFFSFSQNKQKT